MLVSDITTSILDKFLEYKDDKGVKKVTQASIMNHLRRFFRFCYSRNYMKEIQFTIPKYEQEMKDPYTTMEETNIILQCRKLQDIVCFSAKHCIFYKI